jgi:hypothetical protein
VRRTNTGIELGSAWIAPLPTPHRWCPAPHSHARHAWLARRTHRRRSMPAGEVRISRHCRHCEMDFEPRPDQVYCRPGSRWLAFREHRASAQAPGTALDDHGR